MTMLFSACEVLNSVWTRRYHTMLYYSYSSKVPRGLCLLFCALFAHHQGESSNFPLSTQSLWHLLFGTSLRKKTQLTQAQLLKKKKLSLQSTSHLMTIASRRKLPNTERCREFNQASHCHWWRTTLCHCSTQEVRANESTEERRFLAMERQRLSAVGKDMDSTHAFCHWEQSGNQLSSPWRWSRIPNIC